MKTLTPKLYTLRKIVGGIKFLFTASIFFCFGYTTGSYMLFKDMFQEDVKMIRSIDEGELR